MKIAKVLIIITNMLFFSILIITFGPNELVAFIWSQIEKIGALATALALFFAIRQGMHAQQTAKENEKSNNNNLFQQMFNLILEQHNSELKEVKSWLETQQSRGSASNGKHVKDNTNGTLEATKLIRGHEIFSPYMRLLHHILKTIKNKHNTQSPDQIQFLECKRYSSLVRSFIPNEILRLIALNSIITNNSFGENTGYSQYKEYFDNLRYFDFMEHLILDDKRTLYSSLLTDTEDGLINDLYFYILSKHKTLIQSISWSLLPNEDEFLKERHLTELSKLINNSNLCISLFYDLPEKYIELDSNYDKRYSFITNLRKSITKLINPNDIMGMKKRLISKLESFMNSLIAQFYSTECHVVNLDSDNLDFILFLMSESPLSKWLHDNIRVNASKNELLAAQVFFNRNSLEMYSNSIIPKKNEDIYHQYYKEKHDAISIKTNTLFNISFEIIDCLTDDKKLKELAEDKAQGLLFTYNQYTKGIE